MKRFRRRNHGLDCGLEITGAVNQPMQESGEDGKSQLERLCGRICAVCKIRVLGAHRASWRGSSRRRCSGLCGSLSRRKKPPRPGQRAHRTGGGRHRWKRPRQVSGAPGWRAQLLLPRRCLKDAVMVFGSWGLSQGKCASGPASARIRRFPRTVIVDSASPYLDPRLDHAYGLSLSAERL